MISTENILKEYKGVLLATTIGLIAYFSSSFLPASLNSILLALIIGMVVGNFMKIPDNYQSGIGFTSSKLLEFSILFLAFSINYTHIANLGAKSFSVIAIMVVVMLLITYYLAIKVKCPGSTGWLVGFGTTICGSSAIAALSPSITKNKDDIAISMAVVNLFGSIGMIILPIILQNFNLNTTQIGLMIGGTLHSVGNVAGSGYSISNEVGEAAITFKLARVALLSPALIFFNYLVNKNNVKNIKDFFNLPWYLWSFIGITILSSLIDFPSSFLEIMETLGKVILTIAMAAIGLKVSFKKLYVSGKSGIVFGLVIFMFPNFTSSWVNADFINK
ncbi:MAG: putative sulfate exporter family transporter [Bacteroidetes bacterium]|nr:putative sulfate exporter family transporter [Bacteroidota bacterium]